MTPHDPAALYREAVAQLCDGLVADIEGGHVPDLRAALARLDATVAESAYVRDPALVADCLRAATLAGDTPPRDPADARELARVLLHCDCLARLATEPAFVALGRPGRLRLHED